MADQDAGNVYVEYVSYGNTGIFRRLANWLARQKEVLFGLLSIASIAIAIGVAVWVFDDFRGSSFSGIRATETSINDSDTKGIMPDDRPNRFAALESTETHYRTTNVGQFNAAGVIKPVDLRLIVDRQRREILFALPQDTANNLQSEPSTPLSTATRSFSALTTVPQQTVARKPEVFGPGVDFVRSAFACVGCDSPDRLLNYRSVLRLNEAESASDHVRIARAAIDFGEFDTARSHLELATVLLRENLDSPEASNRVWAQIGQTFMVMGQIARGEKLINDTKAFWRVDAERDQVGGLHSILLWEAQFAAFNQDLSKTEDALGQYATVVGGYSISPAQASRWIEDAYATCLMLSPPSTELPVPSAWRTFEPGLGWCKPSAVFAKYKDEPSRPGLEWRDNPDS